MSDERTLTISLVARTDRFSADMRKARGEMSAFGVAGKSLGGTIKGLAGSLGLLVGAGGAVLGLAREMRQGITTAIEFEAAFASVKKTVDATADEYARMKRELIELSKETGQTAVSLFEAAGAAGQLGIAKENIVEFTRTMSQMSIASNLTADEAATGFAKWANITGLSQENIDNLAAAVVALGNTTGATEKDILDMSMRFAGAAKAAGITDAEIAAIAATLTEVGIEAESGGSSVVKIINQIQKAIASGGDELEIFSRMAGMTAREFAETFRDNAAVAIMEVTQGFRDFVESGKPAITLLESIGLQEIRVSQALQGMSGNVDGLRENLKRASDAFEENIALQKEFDAKNATAQAGIDRLTQSWAAFRNELWEGVLPAIGATSDALAEMIEILSKTADAIDLIAIPTQMFGAPMPSTFGIGLTGKNKPSTPDRTELQKQADDILDMVQGGTERESRAGDIAATFGGGSSGLIKTLERIKSGWTSAKESAKDFFSNTKDFATEFAQNIGPIYEKQMTVINSEALQENKAKMVGSIMDAFFNWADQYGETLDTQKKKEEERIALLGQQQKKLREAREEARKQAEEEMQWYRQRQQMDTGQFAVMRAGSFAQNVSSVQGSDYALSQAGRSAIERSNGRLIADNGVQLLSGILQAAQQTAMNTGRGMVAVAG